MPGAFFWRNKGFAKACGLPSTLSWCRSASRISPGTSGANVIAGADCGFGGRSHLQITWAKLKSLTEGAALASRALG